MSDLIDSDNELLESAEVRDLWRDLKSLNMAEPDPTLRQRVLRDLHNARDPALPWWRAILPAAGAQWAGVAATLIIGILVGQTVGKEDAGLDQRVGQMEMQLDVLNQQLLVSRLTATAPSERLAAALQASTLSQRDPQVAMVLLERAAVDSVASVRSAAISALGDEINHPETAAQLLSVFEASDSPIVQMAIVDLILRRGDQTLLEALQRSLEAERLHPSLRGYVEESIGGIQI
ncbi:MAG: HEAT repeat domain-containing protein [Pseudomonadota bacterium]